MGPQPTFSDKDAAIWRQVRDSRRRVRETRDRISQLGGPGSSRTASSWEVDSGISGEYPTDPSQLRVGYRGYPYLLCSFRHICLDFGSRGLGGHARDNRQSKSRDGRSQVLVAKLVRGDLEATRQVANGRSQIVPQAIVGGSVPGSSPFGIR